LSIELIPHLQSLSLDIVVFEDFRVPFETLLAGTTVQ